MNKAGRSFRARILSDAVQREGAAFHRTGAGASAEISLGLASGVSVAGRMSGMKFVPTEETNPVALSYFSKSPVNGSRGISARYSGRRLSSFGGRRGGVVSAMKRRIAKSVVTTACRA